ncbi:uncharacterized protein [Clytia hemisphaerica]|uniref:Uncharacterized protein n=1 Tax=Clytia hemisphaerica TaxID=252671 RepID=A0A7M5V3I9_9CNID
MMKIFILSCVLAITIGAEEEQDFTINQKLHRIQEVATKEGTAGASMPPLNANYGVEKAFGNADWAYGYRSNAKYGNLPAMVWYHFRTEFEPAEVTFRSMGVPGETANQYQLVGTNDEHCNQYSAWTILCENLTNIPVKTRYSSQRCEVGQFHNRRYKCVGIRILGTSYDNTPYVGLGNIRFFKRV